MKSVAVLMCTYNGEKYLKEQLDSILNQKNVKVSIFVRDDGSKDNTLDILREYQSKSRLTWYQGDNVGPAVGFMELLYDMDSEAYDYFAFSDQDDIWFESKLNDAIEAIEANSNEKYALYGANQTLYKNGVPTSNVYAEEPPLDTVHLLNHNRIAGCTMVINKDLAKLIAKSSHIDNTVLKIRMHDLWLALTACVCGEIVFDMNPTMFYRIHERNVVGEADTSLKRRLQRFISDRKERGNSRSRYAAELLRCFDRNIKSDQRQVLELYANYRKSLRAKLALLRAKEIISNTGENSALFRLKVLFNYI